MSDAKDSGPQLIRHLPVLANEIVALMAPREGEIWVDCTVGGAGHSRLIAERLGTTGRLIGLDRDQAMLDLARPVLAELPVTLVQASFDQLDAVLAGLKIDAVDGVLADLGVSSDQLDDPTRGMTFQKDGPLDMRLDQTSGPTAADLLDRLSEWEIADLLYRYAEERHSRRIAKRIVETRRVEPIRTTGQLAELVRKCVPRERRGPGKSFDPATRTFQGLRIAVNDELAALEALLTKLPKLVRVGGRVGIISFHSLEDRRVKQTLRDAAVWKTVTKKPVQAGDEEVRRNPRSRSAKLRVAMRIEAAGPS
jgi:16S rRNA (cytosine1402-N4)-methyltransferase